MGSPDFASVAQEIRRELGILDEEGKVDHRQVILLNIEDLEIYIEKNEKFDPEEKIINTDGNQSEFNLGYLIKHEIKCLEPEFLKLVS